jgi:hypothetical protein
MRSLVSQRQLRYVLLLFAVAAFSVSAVTIVFSACSMYALRRVYGRSAFGLGVLAIAVALLAAQQVVLGAVTLGLAILIAVQAEIEEHGGSVFYSGASAVLASLGSVAFGCGLWKHFTKASLTAELRQQLQPVVDKMAELTSGTVITVDEILQQMPSALAIFLVLVLALVLIWGPQLVIAMGERSRHYSRETLLSFKLPDQTVWLAIVALAGAFVKQSPALAQVVSINVLNVLVILYAFQGLAVVACAFKMFRVCPIWRALWYFVLIVQLFLMLSVIGFADLWLDVRRRLDRRTLNAKAKRIDKEI